MSVVDIEALLKEVSKKTPCGKDLEYDKAFGALERAAQSKSEQQFGDTVVDAEEPDWKEVKKLALGLFSRTKDLRVATYLTRSLVHDEGFPGLAGGLGVICGFLEQYWECVHPQLDAEDDNDPTFRINSLAPLSDKDAMISAVRNIPLVASRAVGRFSLRDIDIAEGTLNGATGDEGPADITVIDAAFLDCDLEELQKTAEAVTQSIAHAQTIEKIMVEHVGTENAPDLANLQKELKQAQTILAERLSRRGVGGQAGQDAGDGDTAGGGVPAQISGEIRSREDVVRMLDKACVYFNRHEPSSPVPLLLQRAKRLVSADFIEVMRELAPAGLSQAQQNAGVDKD